MPPPNRGQDKVNLVSCGDSHRPTVSLRILGADKGENVRLSEVLWEVRVY